ncbi:response regulator transcription factor [Devosia sp. WQ 349]|uniref:response regulator n=1 Tax=Devosia sp. WQ 349K1 TaxID=2800329 RepID=UPI0019085A57|nr:response regulator transcription factor [Devosia sp. WQ 349K1]MBK1793707.1 response regulator transcription factor [Devosia sp. WQ 349K1]
MKILFVEDEPEMAKLVRAALTKSGFVTDWAPSLATASETIQSTRYDLVVLDRSLGDGEGTSLIPVVRKLYPSMPVLVLSAHGTASDKVEGLNLGADDYLAKPFMVDELIARVRALLRRPRDVVTEAFALGNVEVDVTLGQVSVNGQPLEVPRRELLLLESLIRRSGRTVRRSLIEEEVYGFDDEVQANALEPHVSRLRKRLADAGATATLHTVRGVGYILQAQS